MIVQETVREIGRRGTTSNAVVVENLKKVYHHVAVDGISFSIGEGEIFGFLGPNGAGKTTTIRMLLTLIKPTSGEISVFGVDALSHPENVRKMAGYVPQEVSVDKDLTGYENLLLYSKLYGVPRDAREKRIKEVLEYLGLQDRAKSMVSTYSGGMVRRIELAQAMVNRPKILFLDEPSIGLDPSARRLIWELVKRLRSEFGTTIFITTHDMSEADALCDRVAIIDRGKLAVVDEPSHLKSTVGGEVLTVTSNSPNCSAALMELGYSIISNSPEDHFDLLVSDGDRAIPHLLESLRARGVAVEAVSLKKPTLDDVFLKYTGTRMDEGGAWADVRSTRRAFKGLTR